MTTLGLAQAIVPMCLCLSVLTATIASAATTVGKVTFVGTIEEERDPDGGFHARFLARIEGTCDGDEDVKIRWVTVRSGRTDGIFSHNAVNARNAYSTLLSALLSGKNLEIHGLPDCGTPPTFFLDLWRITIGIF